MQRAGLFVKFYILQQVQKRGKAKINSKISKVYTLDMFYVR